MFFKTKADQRMSSLFVIFGLLIVIVPAVVTYIIKTYFFELNNYEVIRVAVATTILFSIILAAYKAISSREEEISKYRLDSVFVLNKEAQIVFCNEQSLSHFGIKDLLGKYISVIADTVVDINGKPLVSGPGRSALKGEVATVIMKSLITGRWISVTANPVFHNGVVTHAVCVMADITSSMSTEIKQNQIISERERFFGMVAHDLKSPLSSIQMSADILKTQLSDETQLKLIEILLRNSKEISALIDDLLDLVKIQAEKIPLVKTEISLSELIDELVNLNSLLFKAKDLEIITQVDATNCFGDRRRLKQIINNLISNAIKFSSSKTSIKLNVSAVDEFCVFCVEDSGPGIPEEMLKLIFDPFTQVLGKNSSRGTGLGLSIVRYLAEAHGGRAWAENNDETGSKFYFTIPVRQKQLF